MSSQSATLAKLNSLAEEKEKELQEVSKRRVEILEESLQEKEEMVKKERTRFRKLREDFEFNVNLIKERDQELARYDILVDQLRQSAIMKEQDMSDLKIKIADLESKLSSCEAENTKLSQHYNQRIRELHHQTQLFKNTKEEEYDQERTEYIKFKKEMELKLGEAKEEMDSQKRQMLSGFEEILRKKEHEHKIVCDEHYTSVQTLELKIRMLEREKDLLAKTQTNHQDEVENFETKVQQLTREMKRKEWEIQDTQNMKDAKITDLKEKVESCQREMARVVAEYTIKFAEQSKRVNERELSLKALRESSSEQERELMETIHSLKSVIENKDMKWKSIEWDFADKLNAKDITISRLQQELEDCRRKMTFTEESSSREIVAKDLELESLRQLDEKLTEDLKQKNEDLQRYQRNLSMALQREKVIEQAKVQLELDWRRKCEEVGRNTHMAQENLIEKLSKSKEEALAQVKELDRQLQQKDEICKVLKRERDLLHLAMKKRGFTIDQVHNLDVQTEVEELMHENETLKAVIQQMREDMEGLTRELNATGRNDTLDLSGTNKIKSDLEEKDATIAKLRARLVVIEEELLKRKTALSMAKQGFVNMQQKWSLEKMRLVKRIEELETIQETKQITAKAYQDGEVERDATGKLPSQGGDREKGAKIIQLETKARKLQVQLRNAVKQIATLMTERDKLTQLASKQRSELSRRPTQKTDAENNELDIEFVQRIPVKSAAPKQELPNEKVIKTTHISTKEVQVTLETSSESETETDEELIQLVQENENTLTDHHTPLTSLDIKAVSTPKQQQSQPRLFSSSSNPTSIDEIWKLLDDPNSFAMLTPKTDVGTVRPMSQDTQPKGRSPGEKDIEPELLIQGSHAPTTGKRLDNVKQTERQIRIPQRLKAKKRLVRNYNVRDDETVS